MSAAEGQKIVQMTAITLQSLRTDEKFDYFWTQTIKVSEELGVHEPELPRKRRAPQRLEVDNSEGHFVDDVKTHYRVIYFAAIDRVTSSIKSRFEQPGYRVYSKLETLLLKVANKEAYLEELEFVCEFYKEDFNRHLLDTQLGIMASNLPQMCVKYDILEYTYARFV